MRIQFGDESVETAARRAEYIWNKHPDMDPFCRAAEIDSWGHENLTDERRHY